MTPAINAAKKAKIPFTTHKYKHDPKAPSYGLEAAEKLGIDARYIYKTLVATAGGKDLAVAIVPVDRHLDLKALAKAMGVKKTAMADPKDVQRATGYVLGGVSPLGQAKRLPTFIDDSAQPHATMFVSAGRRGLEIELAPTDLATLTRAQFVPIASD